MLIEDGERPCWQEPAISADGEEQIYFRFYHVDQAEEAVGLCNCNDLSGLAAALAKKMPLLFLTSYDFTIVEENVLFKFNYVGNKDAFNPAMEWRSQQFGGITIYQEKYIPKRMKAL